MSPDDINYYRGRIEAERARAAAAPYITAADIHGQLADLYEQLLVLHRRETTQTPSLKLVKPSRTSG